MHICLDGKAARDVGCGAGGILASLAERFDLRGIGIDEDNMMIAEGERINGSLELRKGNFFTYPFSGRFDFILLRDVLEHSVDASRMLRQTAKLLCAGGMAYVTYTPFLSPYGGHQHNGKGLFSHVPYLHYISGQQFMRIIRPAANLYKKDEKLVRDLEDVRATFLTTNRVKNSCKTVNLKIVFKRVFIVRPDYKLKFGLPTIPAPQCIPLSTCIDPFNTSVELILKKVTPGLKLGCARTNVQ
jgi:2-polyprenyl-3-methyl-5-hydroxy-6-metoxy-1,4-benzoquinol methylase